MSSQVLTFSRLKGAGPADKQRHSGSALIRRRFRAAHACVEDAHSSGAAVIRHENQHRVLLDAPIGQPVHQLAHVVVDVGTHAEILLGILVQVQAAVHAPILVGTHQGFVRGVGGDVGEEGFSGIYALLDPLQSLAEEHVGAIAVSALKSAVVADHGIEIGVARSVGAGTRILLANAAAAMDEHFVKAAVSGLVRFGVAQVPLPENAGGVARALQRLGERGGLQAHALAFENGVGDAGLELMPARHYGRPRGGTGWAGVKIGEADAFVVETIQIGGLDDWVAVSGDVAVALIVGQDEHDVRPGAGLRLGSQG